MSTAGPAGSADPTARTTPVATASPGPAGSGAASASPQVVRAAGAVCWRVAGEDLQVLLVHRPRYQDWSWPKGKLDPDEVPAVAAVREVEEETGVRVRLGPPLPTARYRLRPGADKQVSYWAAHVGGDLPTPPRPDEVDRTRWVEPREAAALLTRRGDRAQLDALLGARVEGRLDTWPLLVVRHGQAAPRATWERDDAERPLAPTGASQATALAPLLAAWSPPKVVSSPWLRCVDTMAPYVTGNGARLSTKGRLSEAGHRNDPGKVAALVGELLARQRPVVVCTHRPVLGTLLGSLAGHCSAGVGEVVPGADPFLAAGEVLVAHVGTRGRVVAVERHLPLTG